METERSRSRAGENIVGVSDSKLEKTEEQGVFDVSEVKEVKHKVEEEDKHGDDYEPDVLYLVHSCLLLHQEEKSLMTARDFPNAAANQPLQAAPKEFRKALKITSLRPCKFYIHLSSLETGVMEMERKRRVSLYFQEEEDENDKVIVGKEHRTRAVYQREVMNIHRS